MKDQEDVLDFVARMMGTTRARASELTGIANDAIAEVLDTDYIVDQSAEREATLDEEERQVNLHEIADRLHLPVKEFSSWVEDEMIFIEYGQNLSEGIAGEGPTALAATAHFYFRWYNSAILKHQPVLLSDDRHHRYNEAGEKQRS